MAIHQDDEPLRSLLALPQPKARPCWVVCSDSAPRLAPALTPGPRSVGIVQYLDDAILGTASARESLASDPQILINVFRLFGWLIRPTKCVGTSASPHRCRHSRLSGPGSICSRRPSPPPPDTVRRILDTAERLATGPVLVPVRTVARLKGLLCSTWLSTGVATRVRTRLLAAVVDSRPPAR